MTIPDDGESVALFEPLMVPEGSPHRAELNDLALDLAEKSAAFRSILPDSIAAALADLVRSMNCYYSNLIEGHNTHPVDIERAPGGLHGRSHAPGAAARPDHDLGRGGNARRHAARPVRCGSAFFIRESSRAGR